MSDRCPYCGCPDPGTPWPACLTRAKHAGESDPFHKSTPVAVDLDIPNANPAVISGWPKRLRDLTKAFIEEARKRRDAP